MKKIFERDKYNGRAPYKIIYKLFDPYGTYIKISFDDKTKYETKLKEIMDRDDIIGIKVKDGK